MKNNDIENNLLKNALLDLNGVSSILKEGAKGATKDLMKESFREVMSELITESDDDAESDSDNEVKDTTSTDDEETTSDYESSLDLDDTEDESEEDAEWSGFAQKYGTGDIDDDGNEEYDFTSAEDADIERVSDLLKDTDKVKVVKDGENVYRLEDGENEFILIQTDGESDFADEEESDSDNDELSFDLFIDGDALDDSSEDMKDWEDDELNNDEIETSFEITTDNDTDTLDDTEGDEEGATANDTAEDDEDNAEEKPINDNENKLKKESIMRNTYELVLEDDDLGYTDDYQKETATEFPKNKQGDSTAPLNGTGEYGKHTEKDAYPYEEGVNESLMFDLFIDENVTRGGELSNGHALNIKPENAKTYKKRITHNKVDSNADATREYDGTSGEGEQSGKGEQKGLGESIMRRTNKILRENNQLKNALGKFEQDLTEASVANINLQHIVRLVTENTTSAKEKKSIVKQFSKVKTIAESKMLYNAIKRTLNGGANNKKGLNESISKPISAKPSTANEKVIYKSQDLNESLDLMARMNKVKI